MDRGRRAPRDAARPRAHGEHDGVGREASPSTLTPRRGAVPLSALDDADAQRGSARARRVHSAAVKRAGWIWAVVSVEPSSSATTAGPSIQAGAAGRGGRPPPLPRSRARIMNVSMRR